MKKEMSKKTTQVNSGYLYQPASHDMREGLKILIFLK
jgi:hypothetical protein